MKSLAPSSPPAKPRRGTFRADRVYRAFADVTRLRILHLLGNRELCVCDLVAVLGAPQPTISRHLAYLRKTGLIIGRREGLWNHYRLAADLTDLQKQLLASLPACIGTLPELASDRQLLSKRRCVPGECCP